MKSLYASRACRWTWAGRVENRSRKRRVVREFIVSPDPNLLSVRPDAPPALLPPNAQVCQTNWRWLDQKHPRRQFQPASELPAHLAPRAGALRLVQMLFRATQS